METERHNELRRFTPKERTAIRKLCRAKNGTGNRGGRGPYPKPCVDWGMACFECQDQTGAWPAQGIEAEGGDAKAGPVRKGESPVAESDAPETEVKHDR